jgi:hypothetical protein
MDYPPSSTTSYHPQLMDFNLDHGHNHKVESSTNLKANRKYATSPVTVIVEKNGT